MFMQHLILSRALLSPVKHLSVDANIYVGVPVIFVHFTHPLETMICVICHRSIVHEL
jgi:hypothetical protein